MARSTSPVNDAKIPLTPAAWTTGLAATEIHCSANMMRPRPIRIRPKRPVMVFCSDRNSTTPTKIMNGASFFFQAEDGIRDADVTGVQTCALPISHSCAWPDRLHQRIPEPDLSPMQLALNQLGGHRSEEHTSELQSRPHLVCRLLLEKKKTITDQQ